MNKENTQRVGKKKIPNKHIFGGLNAVTSSTSTAAASHQVPGLPSQGKDGLQSAARVMGKKKTTKKNAYENSLQREKEKTKQLSAQAEKKIIPKSLFS